MNDTGSSEEKKRPRPGSARAKLEAFEREQEGRSKLMWRLGLAAGLLAIVLVGQMLLARESDDGSWFKWPQNVAFWAREGDWDRLRTAFAGDFSLRIGGDELTADDLVDAARSRGSAGIQVFATTPHAWEKAEDARRLTFWVVWARGDLSRVETVPLIVCWWVDLRLAREGETWKATRARARRAIGG